MLVLEQRRGWSRPIPTTLPPERATMNSPIDKHNILDEEIFTYKITKDKKVLISYHGKHVITLGVTKAEKFFADIADKNGKEAQLILAKVTGNFKRGNERKSI
ncbi:MAG: hypothetical protein FWE34_06685 [Defluviitaleaceae bacterium]|nr:hypothetical protein [Defluviitaleaceae bacterium]